MQTARRILLIVLFATEVVLGAALFCPCLTDDWRLAAVEASYDRDPTPETQAIKEREGVRVIRNRLILDSLTAGCFILNTFALYLTVKRIRKQRYLSSSTP